MPPESRTSALPTHEHLFFVLCTTECPANRDYRPPVPTPFEQTLAEQVKALALEAEVLRAQESADAIDIRPKPTSSEAAGAAEVYRAARIAGAPMAQLVLLADAVAVAALRG